MNTRIVLALGSVLAACFAGSVLAHGVPDPDQQPGQPGRAPLSGYTLHAPDPERLVETVAVRVDANFTYVERTAIERAMEQWNRALNGYVHLTPTAGQNEEVEADVAGPPVTRFWTLVRMMGRGVRPMDMRSGDMRARQALAEARPGAGDSGLVLVFADRVGSRDLGRIVMHEFGHMLGLTHAKGGLMAPVYAEGAQACIDRATVEKLASLRGLPADQFNWCEPRGRAIAQLQRR
jgi:hypothetical protein